MWCGTVSQFIQLVNSKRLTSALRRASLRNGTNVSTSEETSWDKSLPILAKLLTQRGFDEYFILLEPNLPGTSSRMDAVLLGMNSEGGRSAVIIELKQWINAIGSKAQQISFGDEDYHKLHPCAQVQGYRDYLKLYSSALVDRQPVSNVAGLAFLHNMKNTSTLKKGDTDDAQTCNQQLVSDCPAFGSQDQRRLIDYIRSNISMAPNQEFIRDFIEQEKRASVSVSISFKEIMNDHRSPWVLLDSQNNAFSSIITAMNRIKNNSAPDRQVILITGGPGSGKTIVGLSCLMKAFEDKYEFSNSYLVTTSSAQYNSMNGELSLQRGELVAPTRKLSINPVLKATECRIRPPSLISGQKNSGLTDNEWDAYCSEWRAKHVPYIKLNKDVVIVDEAQGLVMPDKPHVSGSQANSWRRPYGPQPWHIMMSSRLSIFLMDKDQGYRQVESTTPQDIIEIAESENIPVQHISLGTEQFRVSGGAIYSDWLDTLLGFSNYMPKDLSSHERNKLKHIFKIYNEPNIMRNELKALYNSGESSRLLAGYAWEWKSKKDDTLIDSHKGLKLKDRSPPTGIQFQWAKADADGQRAFNLGLEPYDNATSLFGLGTQSPAVVGYPLTVRGREFDHVGVFWGQDLVWRTDHWLVNHNLVFGSDVPGLRKAVNDELKLGLKNGPKMQELVRAVAGGYRILLTRGIKSVSVWIEDPETANHVQKAWKTLLD